jgi:hypothetical protein
MTESAFPLAPQGPTAVAPVEESETDGKRRLLLLVAGVAALLVLVVAVYFLFVRGGSSNSNNNASGLVPSHHVTKTTTAVKKPAATTKTVPSTFNNVLARDPFKPLYVVPPPPPVAPVVGTTTSTSTSTSTVGTTTAAPASQPVTLVKVYSKNGKTFAQTRIGSTLYAPSAGQTFAGTFQLLSINGNAATYVQGDEQFSLSVGQVVLK